MKKAFGYVRTSSHTNRDGDTFVRQADSIKRFAANNDLQVEKFFEEVVSGTKEWEDRPAWVQMMDGLNGVQTIVIEKLDRLARDIMVQEHIVADLRRRGIELLSVHEPDLGGDDPTRVLLRQILGCIASYERSMIVAKLRGARERKRANTGSCEGRKPFGERVGEEATVEHMRLLRGQGLSYGDIAISLNRDQRPTRTGKPWHASVVHQVLTREVQHGTDGR